MILDYLNGIVGRGCLGDPEAGTLLQRRGVHHQDFPLGVPRKDVLSPSDHRNQTKMLD